MDPIDVLRPGTKVDITVTSGRVPRVFMSCIMYLGDETLHLTVPGPENQPTVLPVGRPVTLHIKPENRLYIAQSRVVGYTNKLSPPRLIVARPRTLKRVERRKSVRLSVLIHPERCDLYFDEATGWRRIAPTIMNISAGGVALQHHRPLPVGAMVNLQFGLPNGYGPIRVEGRVVYSRAASQAGVLVYVMGVSFTRIAIRDSDAIMRYVLEQEQLASRNEKM